MLENKVDTKFNQLQVRLERHITEYAYNHDSKMHQMEKHLSEQMNTIWKDHFHSDKRFRQLVENIRIVVTVAGQHIGKLTDHFTTQNKHLESTANYFQASKENC